MTIQRSIPSFCIHPPSNDNKGHRGVLKNVISRLVGHTGLVHVASQTATWPFIVPPPFLRRRRRLTDAIHALFTVRNRHAVLCLPKLVINRGKFIVSRSVLGIWSNLAVSRFPEWKSGCNEAVRMQIILIWHQEKSLVTSSPQQLLGLTIG